MAQISNEKKIYLLKKYGSNRSKNPAYLKEYSEIWNKENAKNLKAYYEKNKTRVIKNAKKRYNKTHDTDRDIVECCCGLSYCTFSENRHLMSDNHAKRMIRILQSEGEQI